jgi:hypothetical protein
MTDRDLVNATGLARWIVANGYRPHMARVGLSSSPRRRPPS